MKVKEVLDAKGIRYKDMNESSSGFSVFFQVENEKDKAIRALMQKGFMITSESKSDEGWKISGIKKKELSSTTIRQEIIEDIR